MLIISLTYYIINYKHNINEHNIRIHIMVTATFHQPTNSSTIVFVPELILKHLDQCFETVLNALENPNCMFDVRDIQKWFHIYCEQNTNEPFYEELLQAQTYIANSRSLGRFLIKHKQCLAIKPAGKVNNRQKYQFDI